MAIKTFTTGEVLTASDTNTYLANAGLVFVKSQTITGTPAAETVTSAFSSTYDNYRIVYNSIATTGLNALLLTFNGSTGSTYNDAGSFIVSGGGQTIEANLARTNIRVGIVETSVSISGWFDCFAPNLNGRTWVNGGSMGSSYFNWRQGVDTNTAQHTAFTLTAAAGTMAAGTITVYGYRKQ
jgi:hypothetical protein